MKQLSLPDDLYNSLEELAAKKGQTVEGAIAEWAESQKIMADQDAFWGPDIDEKLARAEAEIASRPPRYLTEEEFFAELGESDQDES